MMRAFARRERPPASMSTLETVREILADVLQIGDRAGRLEPSSALLGNLPEFDSMAVVGVITAIEQRFAIVIEDDDIDAETFETVGSLVRFIDGKR
jgi:acyl carrier protein